MHPVLTRSTCNDSISGLELRLEFRVNVITSVNAITIIGVLLMNVFYVMQNIKSHVFCCRIFARNLLYNLLKKVVEGYDLFVSRVPFMSRSLTDNG